MDVPSVPLVQMLVNQAYLKRQTIRCLPAAALWWLCERSPFPWMAYRLRWMVRRRRLSNLSFDELLGLLPAGVVTIAQLVDRLTRSRTAKLLCAIPILYPILAEQQFQL